MRLQMRIAILSDIHGNRTAFEAVLKDLGDTAPDLILHGGDLADSGSSPVDIVDHIRSLGWQGVVGNTDEMLAMPETLEEFAGQQPKLQTLWQALREMAQATREVLGEERLAWLRGLPRKQIHGSMALVHAGPASRWRSPQPEAADAELEQIYGPLGQSIAVYGHIHRSYIRNLAASRTMVRTVANTGSISLSYDGDRRASYLLLDESIPTIRRVEYDLDRELEALANSGLPYADWIARSLKSVSPQMP
jgi:predicted phosphodiesterase